MDWKKILEQILKVLPYDKIIEFLWNLIKGWLEKKVADSENQIDDAVFKYAELVIAEIIKDLNAAKEKVSE